MRENCKKNLFTDKNTTNNVSSDIFRGFENGKMIRLRFLGSNHNIKEKWNVFSDYKQTTRCASYIYSVNCNSIGAANGITG